MDPEIYIHLENLSQQHNTSLYSQKKKNVRPHDKKLIKSNFLQVI
jgi:hypothetical protein